MSHGITTIEEFWISVYGFNPMDAGSFITKDAPILTTTTTAFQSVLGAMVTSQVVVLANTLGALSNRPHEKSNFRAISAAASTTTPGHTEGSALPATIKPTIASMEQKPKENTANLDMSMLEINLEGKDDVVTWTEIVSYFTDEFGNRLNRDVTENVTSNPNNTRLGYESIDRIISSNEEVTDCGDVDANDSDPYSTTNDRDSGAVWFDAEVNENGNTDRTFAFSQIDEIMTNIMPFWDNNRSNQNKFAMTGDDTLARMAQIEQAKGRHQLPVSAQFGVNGIQTLPGAEAGIQLASYRFIPIVPDNNAVQDTLSRYYIIDSDHMWLGELLPIQAPVSNDVQLLNKTTRELLLWNQAEVRTDKFKGHGKVRDLK